MSVLEIIFAILLILSCVLIIAVVLMQESKQGMSNVISGGSSDNYYQKNSGRTKEAQLARATKIAAIALFVITLGVNLVSVYAGGTSDNGESAVSADDLVFETGADDITAEDAEDTEDTEDTEAEETEAEENPDADEIEEETAQEQAAAE